MEEPVTYNNKEIISQPQSVEDGLEEYISKKDYVSIDELRQFRISPKHYEYYKKSDERQYEEKNRQIIDGAINCFLYDKDMFHARYIGASVPKYKTKREANELFKETQLMYNTKAVIDKNVFNMIVESCKDISENENIQNIFSEGITGMSMYKVDERTGLKMKGRLSWVSNISPMIFDCKIYDNTYRQFINNYFSTGLYLEASWNSNLFNKGVGLISIESTAPYTHRVEIFDSGIKEKSAQEIRILLDIFSFCKKNNYWFDLMQFEEIKSRVYSADDTIEMLFSKLNEFINKKDSVGNANGLNKGYDYLQLPNWIK